MIAILPVEEDLLGLIHLLSLRPSLLLVLLLLALLALSLMLLLLAGRRNPILAGLSDSIPSLAFGGRCAPCRCGNGASAPDSKSGTGRTGRTGTTPPLTRDASGDCLTGRDLLLTSGESGDCLSGRAALLTSAKMPPLCGESKGSCNCLVPPLICGDLFDS